MENKFKAKNGKIPKKKNPMSKELLKIENNDFMNEKEKNYITFINEKSLRRQKSLFDYSKIFLSEPEYLEKENERQKIKEEKQKKYQEKMERMATEDNLDLEILMLNSEKKQFSKIKPATKSKKVSRIGSDYFVIEENSKLFIDLLIESIYENCLGEQDLEFLEDYSPSILIRIFTHKKAYHLLKKYREIRVFLMKNSHFFMENPLEDFLNENFELFNFSEVEVVNAEFQTNFDFSDLGVQIACSIIFNDFSISNLFVNFDESTLFEDKKSEERVWAFLNLLFKFSSKKSSIIKNLRNTILNCEENRKPYLENFLSETGLKKKL